MNQQFIQHCFLILLSGKKNKNKGELLEGEERAKVVWKEKPATVKESFRFYVRMSEREGKRERESVCVCVCV